MSEASTTRPRSPLDIGVMLALATLSVAALAGLVAVLEAESVASGFARGFGIAFAILLAGGTIAAAVSFLGNLAAALLLVPVLLEAWGPERYGSWLALLSLFGVLTTFDTGHHNYVGNELMRLYPVDRVAARRVLASALLAALCLGVIELVLVLVLLASGALPWALGQAGRSPAELSPALVLPIEFMLPLAECLGSERRSEHCGQDFGRKRLVRLQIHTDLATARAVRDSREPRTAGVRD